MTEINVTSPDDTGRRFRRHVWEGLQKGDTGTCVSSPGVASMYVQVVGITGIVAMEGSLGETPEHYFMLQDHVGMPVYLKDGEGTAIPYPGVMHVRPRVTDGDDDTDFTVILFTRSN